MQESSNATKVCLAADSEQELLAVRDQARKAGTVLDCIAGGVPVLGLTCNSGHCTMAGSTRLAVTHTCARMQLNLLKGAWCNAGLQTAVVVDASSGSTNRSVLAVGPGASSVINSFTHQLKIYDD